MRTLYLDCQMGCAGDMFAGALFDTLADNEKIECLDYLRSLEIPDVSFVAKKVSDCGVVGTSFKPIINGDLQEGPGGRVLKSPTLEKRKGKGKSKKKKGSKHREDHQHIDLYALGLISEDIHDRNDNSGHSGNHSDYVPERIGEVILSLGLNSSVESDALAIFALLARAEARAHGVDVSHVHFHEVGAMDAIADVVAASVLMWLVNPSLVLASAINVGSGEVRCQHGTLPVPTPAVANLLRSIPMYSGSIDGTVIKAELCTPTGAAILRHFVTEFTPMPNMRIADVGYGFGNQRFDAPNCLRAFIGELDPDPMPAPFADASEGRDFVAGDGTAPSSSAVHPDDADDGDASSQSDADPKASSERAQERVAIYQMPQPFPQPYPAYPVPYASHEWISPISDPWSDHMAGSYDSTDAIVSLSCNIDDMSPEDLGFAFEALSDSTETLDVYMQPIQMKKSRPATMLTALVRPGHVEYVARMIFELTTTIGIRTTRMNRLVLDRHIDLRDTPLGKLRVKVSEGYGVKREKPEFDDVAKALMQIQERK